MENNKNYSKEEQNSKPKKTRSSKQQGGIWIGAGALLAAVATWLLTGGKGNDGGKQT